MLRDLRLNGWVSCQINSRPNNNLLKKCALTELTFGQGAVC